MEILLAWGIYLSLGVVCAALGWAWLGPRLPRPVRLAVLGLLAALAVAALAVTAQIPHDYRANDLAEFGHGVAAIIAEWLVAIVGTAAALAAVGRRRTQNAGLFGAGLYIAGAGLALYLMLEGRPTVQAPTLVLVGTTVAVAAAGRLAGLPRWLARTLGLAAGLVIAPGVEALRGAGSVGAGPLSAPREMLLLVGAEAALLLLGCALLVRSQDRVLTAPLARAALALIATGITLLLRGPGEWAPVPGARSTTLYGLPLTLLVVTLSLAIPDEPVRRVDPLGRRMRGSRSAQLRRVAPLLPLAGALLLLSGLFTFWHPAAPPCAAATYASASPLTPSGPAWALSPDPAHPRGAPDVAEFDGACPDRTSGVGEIVYAVSPTCKWAQVDPNYPLVQATGTLTEIDLSNQDSPWIHTSHDVGFDLALERSSAWAALGKGAPGAILHVEAESGPFPLPYRPAVGDRVTVAGRWIFDCGHEPKTEIHPAAVVASEHDEWRTELTGKAQQVRALRVWMNAVPGVVHVPLAPFDLSVGFPARAAGAGQPGTPLVRVVSGPPAAVRWAVNGGESEGAGATTEAAVHITPPAAGGAAYFELLLGYSGAAPSPPQPVSYSVTFDRLFVLDELRSAARNTAGGTDLAFPQLGFPGLGHWTLQAIAGHTWRSLLEDAPVASGHTYSLAGVPPVSLLAPGDEHLRFSITGYAENDPSAGVELASGSVEGAALVSWDLGQLADLCCGAERALTPAHAAWTLYYHVSRGAP